jgi:hypothetical protein
VGSAYGASHAGPARGSRPTWPFGPRSRGRGACAHGAHGTGRRRPSRIPTVPVTSCSGEGPRSKAVGWWTSFGAVGRKLTGEAGPQWRGSAAGKRHRQAGVGVTSWVRVVGEELLDGAVLEVWLTRPKRGWSGLSAAARVTRGGAVVRARRVCRGRSGSDRAADGWPPRGFNFSNLTKTSSNLEFEKECCLTLLQKFPNFSCC